MGNVASGVSSLIGGVSRQHPTKRLSSQCEEQINCYCSPHNGLSKRPPTVHLADISLGLDTSVTPATASVPEASSDARLHSISRDRDERYLVTATTGRVRVFDTDGTEFGVYAEGGGAPDFSYLDIRRDNYIASPQDFSAWTTTDEANAATRTELLGPFDFGYWYRLSVTPTTNTPTDDGYYYAVTNLTNTFQSSLSVYAKLDPDEEDGSCDVELVLVEDPTGTPTNHWALFTWVAGVLTWDSASSVDVDADVEAVGDGVYRARMVIPHTDLAADAPTRAKIMTRWSGDYTGAETYSVIVFGAHSLGGDTISTDDGFFPSYTLGTARESLRMLTVADYTFISNRVVPVEKTTSLSAAQNGMGDGGIMIYARQFDWNMRYTWTVKVDTMGSEEILTFTTGDGTSQEDSTDIITDFTVNVLAGSLSTYDIGVVYMPRAAGSGASAASVAYFYPTYPAVEFDKFMVADGRGDDFIAAIKDRIDDFVLLPSVAAGGYKVRVDADPTIEEEDYWVIFERKDDDTSTSILGDGRWVESIAPEIEYQLDASTMPHQLTRQVDTDGSITGTNGQIYFEWAEATWDERLVGDDTTNAWPPFVSTDTENRYVEEMFFHQDRLGFLSGSTVSMSGAADYFNWFRTTVRQVLDGDRFVIEPTSQKVTKLYTAAALDERLILIGDQTQFVMRGEPTLTGKTVSAAAITTYDSLPNPPAVPSGETMFFAAPDSGDSKVYEVIPLTERDSFTSNDVTAQVPRYIEGEIQDLASSPNAGFLVALSDENTDRIYCFNWATAGDEKIQAAWSYWSLDGDVVGLEWIEQTMYILIRRTDVDGDYKLFLEKVRVSDLSEDTNLEWQIHLDRREELVGVYSSATNQTTFTFSYDVTDPAMVTQPASDGSGLYRLQVHSHVGDTVAVIGDYSAYTCWAGELYESTYKFSRPYLRERAAAGGIQSVLSLPTSLVALVLELRDTFQLDLEVQGEINTDSYRAIRGPEFGESTLGTFRPYDGMFRCGVMSDPRREEVVLTNDSPWPFRVMGAEWEMDVTSRGKRAPV